MKLGKRAILLTIVLASLAYGQGGYNPDTITPTTTPWSLNWLTHPDDATAQTDLGMSAWQISRLADADAAARLTALGFTGIMGTAIGDADLLTWMGTMGFGDVLLDLRDDTDTLESAASLDIDWELSVEWYGATGDGSTDDYAAVHACEVAAAAAGKGVYFPPGDYALSGALDCSAQSYRGAGSAFVTLKGTSTDTPIFSNAAGFSSRRFIGFSIRATADGVTAFYCSTATAYVSYCVWSDVEFYLDLQYGIRANLIFANIQNCRWGYMGSLNGNSHHVSIESDGTSSKWTNINTVRASRFFAAQGGDAAVCLTTGAAWNFDGCDFEALHTAAVDAAGILQLMFHGCWFEPNKDDGSGADYCVKAYSDGTQGTNVLFVGGFLQVATSDDIDHVVNVASTCSAGFIGCAGNLGGYWTKKSAAYDDGLTILLGNIPSGYSGALPTNYWGYSGRIGSQLAIGNEEICDITDFATDDWSPSVNGVSVGRTNMTAPHTISTFDNGETGQRIKVIVQEAQTTLNFASGNLKGNGGVNDTGPGMLDAVFDGTDWHCQWEPY